jgi:UDP-glucose 4-epimerase
MTILITGAGHIGCEIARQLLAQGERVVLFDIDTSKPQVQELARSPALVCVDGDVTSLEQLRAAVDAHAVRRIVHTAAILIPASQASPLRSIAINVMGAANVMEIGRTHELDRVVLAGSSSVIFGVLGDYPGGTIPDDFPMKVVSQVPDNFYAAGKLSAEFLAGRYAASFGLDVVVLRYSSVIRAWSGADPGLVGRVLRAFVDQPASGHRAVIDDPTLIWDGVEEFVDARDCARVTLSALRARRLPQRVYNIVGPGAYTTSEFADLVRQAFPQGSLEIRATTRRGIGGGPVRHARLDGSAAARDLGYQAAYQLGDSLRHYARLSVL